MAKRFYDTGLPDQLWYQKLSPKCKALYLHLLCKCDVAGTFEINYPMMSAYVGDTITESDLFGSFGNRVVPLTGSEVWRRDQPECQGSPVGVAPS